MERTLPETNIVPETRPSQKEFHLRTINFQGRAVSFREERAVVFFFSWLMFGTSQNLGGTSQVPLAPHGLT